MTKWKPFFDFHKEELWLADMSRNGYRLIKYVNGYYTFDYSNDRTEYTYKIDYRTFYKVKDYRNYCTLFEDSGWKHIAGSQWSGSQYFVKIRSNAGDDIFSDNLSRAGRYKRISYLWLSFVLCYSFILYAIIAYKTININQFYLTPGLWDMNGWNFFKAFVFETPFALLRLFPFVIYPVLIAYYAYFAIKSLTLYKKEMKNRYNV